MTVDEQRIDIIISFLQDYESKIDDADYCTMAEIRFSIRDLKEMKEKLINSRVKKV